MYRPRLLSFCAALQCAASSTWTPPGSLFNLSTWKLQTPIADGSGIMEVSQPALATYNSSVFYSLDGDESAYFWTPENGATTSGSNFPRSELRNDYDWFAGSTGRHVLNATIRVLDDGPLNTVTIGQIHGDGLSGACSIIIELEWKGGQIIAHVRDKKCKNINIVIDSGYKLGDAVTFSLSAEGTKVSASTPRTPAGAGDYDYTWLDPSVYGSQYNMYFKVGNYLQASGPSAAGSLTTLDALYLYHGA